MQLPRSKESTQKGHLMPSVTDKWQCNAKYNWEVTGDLFEVLFSSADCFTCHKSFLTFPHNALMTVSSSNYKAQKPRMADK